MKRYLAIGDIHGCFNSLSTLLEFVGVNSEDTLITLGDYVDSGPNSKAVLDWLISFYETGQLVPLRGNHEIMMLNARDDERSHQIWMSVGGQPTMDSYAASQVKPGCITDIPDAHWQFLESKLLPAFETDRHFFVHANAYPNIAIDAQPERMLYWEPFNYPAAHKSGKVMVCGHSSQKSGLPCNHEHAICIDTWAYGQGWLTCLDVESSVIWQANESGETRQMTLEELDDPSSDE